VKERPINFSAEMIRALLREENPKSMTRRIINWPVYSAPLGLAFIRRIFLPDDLPELAELILPRCPYGQPGDRLFVTQGASFDKTIPFEDRFWSRVYQFGSCWEWFGRTNRKGYGIIRQDGLSVATQRASWRLHNGPIPNGMHVLHTCDLPWCVNPSHLYIGKNEDNIRDKVMRGRTARQNGAKNGQSKLTATEVAEIKALYWEQDIYQHQIASQFNISQPEVSRIVHEKRWNSTSPSRPLMGHRWLEITAVRVERLQDISDEDAEAEGLSWCNAASPRDKFQCLWNSLNAKRGYGWDANPWVWVISFKRVK
jgi:hypothetical protein